MNIIFIPYRDREKHLDYFVNNLAPRLNEYINSLKIVIVEQGNDKKFNRGKLLNVGFMEYKKQIGYLYQHDIDVIPSDETIKKIYTLETGEIIRISAPHATSLGCIVKMSKDNFIKMNGYPNNIWGWGIEDRALFCRALLSDLKLSKNFCNEAFKKLPHKSNVEVYKNEKKIISDIWLPNNIDKMTELERINLVNNDGLNNTEYTLLKREIINDYIEKIIVEI